MNVLLSVLVVYTAQYLHRRLLFSFTASSSRALGFLENERFSESMRNQTLLEFFLIYYYSGASIQSLLNSLLRLFLWKKY